MFIKAMWGGGGILEMREEWAGGSAVGEALRSSARSREQKNWEAASVSVLLRIISCPFVAFLYFINIDYSGSLLAFHAALVEGA